MLSTVSLTGFEFDKDLGRGSYSPDRNCLQDPLTHQWVIVQGGRWKGGTITITNDWGTSTFTGASFVGYTIIEASPALGYFGMSWGTVSAADGALQLAFTDFDGRQAKNEIDGGGRLTFTSPPKLSISSPPSHGTAVVEKDGGILYKPKAGTEVVDSFQYTIMTQLGDSDQATVDIGTMDLDVLNFDSSFLNEVSEDNPGSFVRLNIDDDDYNESADLNDIGIADDDLVRLTIIPRVPASIADRQGYFTISYDETIITVWHQDDKLQPSGYTSPVVQASTRIDAHASVLDFQMYVEGRAIGKTTISLSWHDTDLDEAGVLDSVVVNVMDLDLDIDSDNNNDFDLPDRSLREEFLESNRYGLGKLVMQNYSVADAAEKYTPIRVSLPPGLSLSDPQLRVRLKFDQYSEAGQILLWLRDKNDPLRDGDDASIGGDLVQSDVLYTLGDLRYSPTNGEIILYVAGLMENPNIKQLAGVEVNGKPQKAVKATLVVAGVDMVSDHAKYIVSQTNSFFYRLQHSEELRNALAASRVYERADSPDYVLQLLENHDLNKLGISSPAAIAALTQDNPADGFKAGLFRDYVSDKLVLSFAGTEPELQDVLHDIYQGLGLHSSQYETAAFLGNYLASIELVGTRLVTTGHSLGGGLASAAVVASGITADTFNAAGLTNSQKIRIASQYPNQFSNDPVLIDAYYVDWDLLSYLQDNLESDPVDPMASAMGIRRKMDGPFDTDVTLFLLNAITEYFASDIDPIRTIFNSLPLWPMVSSHYRGSYLYGLLVKENSFGTIVEDLLGYSKAELKAGRRP